jgi:hypothetical protein
MPERNARNESAAYRSQRLLRVRVGSSIPAFWRFVQWVDKETNMLTGEWEDVVLCEYDPEWVEATSLPLKGERQCSRSTR